LLSDCKWIAGMAGLAVVVTLSLVANAVVCAIVMLLHSRSTSM
jgi:hypothetical protein